MEKSRILDKQEDCSIPWFKQIRKTVVLSHDPAVQTYYSIKPPDYVTIVAKTGDEKVIILRQFRPAVEDYTFELPSGHVEKGETPLQAVIRELEEESSAKAGDAVLLGEVIPDTGRLENRLWAFYADNVEITCRPEPEKNEGIEVLLVSREELFDMIDSGQLNHALDLSVIALSVFKKYL